MDVNLNLSFKNLCYEVKENFYSNRCKKILKSINGEINSFELTAIVGPSGSGKSSLMNSLSGYKKNGVTGSIKLNNCEVSSSDLRKYSSYIMQENDLQDFVTVDEAMTFAARFKNLKNSEEIIAEVLKSLNFEETRNNLIGTLSGGQKKRLAIALELIDNPSIIFLDECTTGLDSSSAFQCVQMLKNLSKEGRTIICSIHQPSPKVFALFDQIYALAEGSCVYQGSPGNLIKFFCDVNLPCPRNYSLCDFLLEIASNAYGNHNDRLIERVKNGNYENSEVAPIENTKNSYNRVFPSKKLVKLSLVEQISILLDRNILTTLRDKKFLSLNIGSMLVLGLLFGLIGPNVGVDASKALINSRIIVCIQSMFFITCFNSSLAKIPLQYSYLKREHFNRWYTESAYLIAMVIGDLPALIIGCFSGISIAYFMTGQPTEMFRFVNFFMISLMSCWASQGVGLVGSVYFDVFQALVYGMFLMSPIFLYSLATSVYVDVPKLFHGMFSVNFLHNTMDSSLNLIYGYNRSKIECNAAVFCRYSSPEKLIKDISVSTTISKSLMISILYGFCTRLLCYVQLRHRLRKD